MWALTANTVSQDGFLSSSACCARSAGFPANEWKVECVNPEYLSLGCTGLWTRLCPDLPDGCILMPLGKVLNSRYVS